jgi:glyoxylase-like metal-dependent hydrolase (beta-lactamase superfamily II)
MKVKDRGSVSGRIVRLGQARPAGVRLLSLLFACLPFSIAADVPAFAVEQDQMKHAAEGWSTRATGVERFMVATLGVVVLYDGGGWIPNDNKVIGVNVSREDVAKTLRAARTPPDKMLLDHTVLLVRMGARLFVVDPGLGSGSGLLPHGRAMASMREAQIDPGEVTDVIVTHGHFDHVDGLIDDSGKPAFPNARVFISEAAATAIDAPAQAAVDAIRPRLTTFKPGDMIAPGVSSIDVPGHTPGHVAVLFEGGSRNLLAIGDTAHHYITSIRRPDYEFFYDADRKLGVASRKALLSRAAAEKFVVYAPHFPFPGMGTISPDGDGFKLINLKPTKAKR